MTQPQPPEAEAPQPGRPDGGPPAGTTAPSRPPFLAGSGTILDRLAAAPRPPSSTGTTPGSWRSDVLRTLSTPLSTPAAAPAATASDPLASTTAELPAVDPGRFGAAGGGEAAVDLATDSPASAAEPADQPAEAAAEPASEPDNHGLAATSGITSVTAGQTAQAGQTTQANQANQATKPTKTPKQPKQPKPPKTAKASKRRGTLARGGLAVWVVAIIAIVCLGAGFALRGLIRSPAEAEADAAPPAAGLITARVEARQITSTVVSRADVVYADPVAVNPPIPDGAQAPVVTGHVPEEGAEITAGTILLEVSGRPVFVLPGEFPAYRSLGPDSQGPDVAQLRAALAGLGYAAGTEGATEYDADLAAAVAALYTEAGYPPPGSDDQAKNQAVRDAAAAVEDAKDARDRAWTALSKARAAISAEDPSTQAAADAAQESYQEADKQVTRAEETLTAATRAAWTTAPYGEMVFVSGLPRRVDEVNVTLGQTVGTPSADQPLDAVADDAVVLSGAEITVTAQVSAGEAALLVVGGPAVLLAHTGLSVNGTIDSICDYAALENGSGDAATTRCPVGITLGDLGEVNRSDLVGNVQVTMVVGVSAAGSLVVPVAAVSANSAGQAQVELVVGELTKGAAAADQPTQMVTITTGLAAEGYVEVKAAEPTLQEGDLVVVGLAAASQPTQTATPDS